MSTQLTNAKRPRKVALVNRKAAPSRRWHSAQTHPPRRGWYEVRSLDDIGIPPERFRAWRAWMKGCWWQWTDRGWWLSSKGWPRYQWRGPGKSIDLDYHQLPIPGGRA